MKPLPARKLISILERNGFVLKRQKGSHAIYFNAYTNKTLPVPLHGKNKPIFITTFMDIVKQSGLPKNLFH